MVGIFTGLCCHT